MGATYKEILTLELLKELLHQYCLEHRLEPEVETVLDNIKTNVDFVFKEIDGYNLTFEIKWKEQQKQFIQQFNSAWNNYYYAPTFLKELLKRSRAETIKRLEKEWIEYRIDIINAIKDYCEKRYFFNCEYFKRKKYKKLAKLFYDNVERICNDKEDRMTKSYFSNQTLNEVREYYIKVKRSELMERVNTLYYSDLKFFKGCVIDDYCSKNKIKNEVVQALYTIANVDIDIANFIIRSVHLKSIESSGVSDIVDSYKSHYEKKVGIKPIERDFIEYLVCNVDEVYDLRNDTLKRYLADFMVHEKEKIEIYDLDAHSKINEVYDITPHQTLSIETTSATVEDSNRDKKLSMREIALIYWYDRDNLSFSKSTAQQIAEAYRHTSKSSGLSLYKDHYLKVSNDEKQRTNNDTSVQYLSNIIPTLTTDRGKREANEDLKKAHEFKEQKKKRLF